MLFTVAKSFVCLMLIFSTKHAFAKQINIKDPIFGLRFDNKKHRFEKLPSKTIENCPVLVTPLWGRESWIFARATNGSSDYIIIGGLFVKHTPNAKERKFEPDVKGAVININGSNCALVGPADEFFETKPNDIDAGTLKEISKDLEERYFAVFDGRDNFMRIIDHLKSSRAKILIRNIESFSK